MYEMDPACASVCLCVCLPCIRTPIRIPIFSSFSAVFAGNNKSNCNNHSKCYTNSRKLLPKVTLLRYFSFFLLLFIHSWSVFLCFCIFMLTSSWLGSHKSSLAIGHICVWLADCSEGGCDSTKIGRKVSSIGLPKKRMWRPYREKNIYIIS